MMNAPPNVGLRGCSCEERVLMEIRCRCSGCQAKFKVDAKYAGKKARCPKCQQVGAVPLQNSLDESTITSWPATSLPAVGPRPPAPAGPGISNSALIPPKTTPAPTQSATFPKPASPAAGKSAIFTKPASAAAPLPAGPPASPADPLPNFNFNSSPAKPISSSASAIGSASQSGAPPGRKKSSPLPLLIGGGIAAVLLVGIGIVAVLAMSLPTTSGKPLRRPQIAVAANQTALILDWPEAERRGAGLSINGRKEPIPQSGELKFVLAPGAHRLVIQRRGFEPIEEAVTLAAGESERFAPQWQASAIAVATPPVGPATTAATNTTSSVSAPSTSTPGSTDFPVGTAIESLAPQGFEGWLQNFDLAKRQAAAASGAGNLGQILVVFGCSDVQRETQELARGLKAANVTASMACVVIDFPRTREAFNLVADRGQNEQMLSEFGIKALPTLVLTDAQGRAYFIQHEWDEGYGDLASKLAQWQQKKEEVGQLLAQTRLGDEPAQLAAAAKVVKWVQDNKVWRFYGAEFARWMTQAQRHDPENKQALLEVFFEPQWFVNLTQIDDEDAGSVARVAAQLDPWATRKFQDQDRGAKLHMTAAFLLAQVERFDAATAQIDLAAKYQPKDAKLAEALADVKRRLENKVLGSGTGYLISAPVFCSPSRDWGRGWIETVPRHRIRAAEVVAQDADRDIALLKVALPALTNTSRFPWSAIRLPGRSRRVRLSARRAGNRAQVTDGSVSRAAR
jgi:hypothetical protein